MKASGKQKKSTAPALSKVNQLIREGKLFRASERDRFCAGCQACKGKSYIRGAE